MTGPEKPPIPFPKRDGRWEDRADSGLPRSTAEPLVGAEVVARDFGVDAAHIRRLARRNAIPHFKVGRTYRFDLEEVKRSLRQEAVGNGSQLRNAKGGNRAIRVSGAGKRRPKDQAIHRDASRGEGGPRRVPSRAAENVSGVADELEQRIARAVQLIPLSDSE